MNVTSKFYVLLLIFILGWLGYKIFQSFHQGSRTSPSHEKQIPSADHDKGQAQFSEDQPKSSHSGKTRRLMALNYPYLIYYEPQSRQIEIVDPLTGNPINIIDLDASHLDTLFLCELIPNHEKELVVLSTSGGSGGHFQTCQIFTSLFDSGRIVQVFSLTGGLEEFDLPTIDEESSEFSIYGRTFSWSGDQFVEKNLFTKIDGIPGVVDLLTDPRSGMAKLRFSDEQELTFPIKKETIFRLISTGTHLFLVTFFDEFQQLIQEAKQYRMEIYHVEKNKMTKLFSRVVAHRIGNLTDGYRPFFSVHNSIMVLYFTPCGDPDSIFAPVFVAEKETPPAQVQFRYVLENNGFQLEERINWN